MENNIQTKVNKIGKAGKIVSVILVVLLSIGAFGLLVAGAVCAFIPKDAVDISVRPAVDVLVSKSIIGNDWNRIDELLSKAGDQIGELEGVKLVKTEEGLMVQAQLPENEERFDIRDGLKAVWAGFVAICSALVTLVMFMKLCDAFRVSRTPFDEPVIRRMNTFAWTLIICSVVGSFATAAVSSAVAGLTRGIDSFSLNLAPVFAALIVFFLCMIFRYGAELQREADETL